MNEVGLILSKTSTFAEESVQRLNANTKRLLFYAVSKSLPPPQTGLFILIKRLEKHHIKTDICILHKIHFLHTL